MVSALLRTVTEMKAEIRRRFAWVYEKLGDFLGVSRRQNECSVSEEEAGLIRRSEQLAESFFGSSVSETLVSLSPQRRMALMEDFVYGLLDLYGMSQCDVVITDSEQIFSEAETASYMGKCALEDGVIYLNSHFLLQQDERILRKCGLSAVHEVRHMMQWQIVRGNLALDIPADTVELWRRNLSGKYVRATADFEAYYKQPVEADARRFADQVMGRF